MGLYINQIKYNNDYGNNYVFKVLRIRKQLLTKPPIVTCLAFREDILATANKDITITQQTQGYNHYKANNVMLYS